MVNKMQNNRREKMLFGLLLIMLLAVFLSRVLLSLSMIGFVCVALVHSNFLQQIKSWCHNYFLLGLSLLFIIPFVSYLWSTNTAAWLDVIRVKLPLMFLPIAFAGKWLLSQKQQNLLAFVFLLLVFISSLWSFSYYITNIQVIHEGYLKAKVISTPFENDHIRFSWIISVAVLLCLFFIESTEKLRKFALTALAAWFIVYLHILSARTGLFCLYAVLFCNALRLFFHIRKRKLAMAGMALIILLPLLAWFFFPTFQNRIAYFFYDFTNAKANQYLPGSNDGSRVLSIKAGWTVLREHPFGVGAGDVFDKAGEWYQKQVPNMISNDKLFPSSEWLIYGCIAGWIGVLLFTAIMVFPFLFKQVQHRFFWIMLQLVAVLSFLFDIGLESQYGVFLYAFIMLWWWKWFSNTNAQNKLR
ncbi:MAG: hypothetical protein C4330_02435 [Chitinophagaceae bacterium]